MDITTFVQILNEGIPSEALGGITSAIAIDLFGKAKKLFKNKEINIKNAQELLQSNEDFKSIFDQISTELKIDKSIINESSKTKIKNQFNYSTFNNPTFK